MEDRKLMHAIKTIGCAAALAALIVMPSAARADQWNKLTYLTFSGPVQVPGHTLPAGTYTFKLADVNDRHVVQIYDKATSKLLATVLTIPDERLDPADKPVVMFKETPSGTPSAIQAWFYPGNTIGDEFVYPRSQAIRIAKATHRSVLSMSDESASKNDMKGAIGRVGENGEESPETTTGTSGTAAPKPATTTAEPSEPRASAATPTTTAAPMRRARRLPQTASPLALYELMSGLAMAGAFGLRRLRSR
jgi:hypothetical protein